MEENCTICSQSFDQFQHYPMMLCYQQHLCCNACLEQLFKQEYAPHCPECRAILDKRKIKKFRLFQKWSIKIIQKHNLELQKQIAEKINTIVKPYKNQKSRPTTIIKSNGNTLQIILQDLIERDPMAQDVFKGLGSRQQEKGFSENLGIEWYQNRYFLSNLSYYDQLALRYMLYPNYEEQKKWYQKIISKNISNYKALYGLALTQHNHGNNNAAIQIYKTIIKMKPTFEKPFEMLAFIYLEMNDLKQAFQYSEDCININPENIFAKFVNIVASHQFGSGYIHTNMKKILQRQPTYGSDYHISNNILKQIPKKDLQPSQLFELQYYNGIVQLGLGQYPQALRTFQQCLLINKQAQCIHIKLGDTYRKMKNFKSASSEYEIWLNKHEDDTEVIQYVVDCYIKLKEFRKALDWLYTWKNFQYSNSQMQLSFGIIFYERQRYSEAITWLNKCMDDSYQLVQVYPRIIMANYKIKDYYEALRLISQYLIACPLTAREHKNIFKLGEEIADCLEKQEEQYNERYDEKEKTIVISQ